MMSHHQPAVPSARLMDAAYWTVKREIVECALPPGIEVSERELMERYGLSKAPLREALVRLGQEGLLRAIPRSGYQVTPITVQDVQDIFALRLLLEPAAARQAAGHVDEALLSELDAVCRAGYIPGDRQSETAFLRTNREFHLTIAQAARNRRLAGLLGQLLEEMERLFHLGLAVRNRTVEMQHEHRALVEALTRGDGDAAEATTIEQIESARRMVMDGILSASWLKQQPVTSW
jgi:DNA-binding GntR family transcriptional regulator